MVRCPKNHRRKKDLVNHSGPRGCDSAQTQIKHLRYDPFMAAPSLIFCREKLRLMQAFTRILSEHHRLQSAHVAALVRGEDFPLEVKIEKLAEKRREEKRRQAKHAILVHQREN